VAACPSWSARKGDTVAPPGDAVQHGPSRPPCQRRAACLRHGRVEPCVPRGNVRFKRGRTRPRRAAGCPRGAACGDRTAGGLVGCGEGAGIWAGERGSGSKRGLPPASVAGRRRAWLTGGCRWCAATRRSAGTEVGDVTERGRRSPGARAGHTRVAAGEGCGAADVAFAALSALAVRSAQYAGHDAAELGARIASYRLASGQRLMALGRSGFASAGRFPDEA
jgi:hypothetical protein